MSYKENNTESEILQMHWSACLDGDTNALKKLHDSLFHGLVLYAQKLLQDEDLADDAVQNLFIKLWEKRQSIGQIKMVKSYCYTALRRQILNQLRDLKLRKFKITFSKETDIEFSHEEIIIKKESDSHKKQQILDLLNQLPKRQKELIYLHYFEGLEYNQIAEIMQVNYQSVLNLKQKAIAKMKSFAASAVSIILFILIKKISK